MGKTLLPKQFVRITIVLFGCLACWLAGAQPASAAPEIRYGIQDDAWLLGGPGTYQSRLRFLKGLGVDLVRVNVRWDQTAPRRPRRPTRHTDRAYRWNAADALLNALQDHGIGAVVTLIGTLRWANGGRGPAWAPRNPAWFGSFAYAAARRYPQVRHWVIWNEPNKNWSLRPTTAATYVPLLNAAYAAIKRVNRRDVVAGGVTAPRGGSGDVEPVDFMRGMRAAGARLDAYAHHFLIRDERNVNRWQSGLLTFRNAPKPALRAFRMPLLQGLPRGATAQLSYRGSLSASLRLW